MSIDHKEETRLQSLHSLKILDTDADDVFDQITRLLETALNFPIVLISLVDRDRQWFKSCIGLDVRQTSRELSFCSDAIQSDEAMYIVSDASLDPKYCKNVLVLGDPKIRFYAGRPICGPSKEKIGTICVIDRKPRVLTHDQVQLIEICANLVESEIKKVYLENQIKAIEGSHIVIEFNMDGVIESANRSFLDLMEYDITEVLHKHHKMFVEDSTNANAEYVEFWRLLKSGKFQQGEFKRYGKNRKEVWLRATYTPILDINGVPVKVIKYAVDVTTEKQQNAQIARYCRELEKNEEKMNAVSAVISHDLINSISPIESLVELVLCNMTDPDIIKDLELVRQSACDALSLSRDLLDAYKLDLNKLEINKAVVKVSKLLEHYNERKKVNVDFGTDVSVFVDRQRIEQVLSNLIQNAEDFADHVTISVKQISDDFVQVSVQDNGIGIPKEKQNLLFQQFGDDVHANDVRRRKPRTGLGLFICKRLVELHGGNIWLDQNTLKGACFCFTLPVQS